MNNVYGVIAEFDTPEALLTAAQAAHDLGYRKMDAYAPLPVDGLAEALGFKRNAVAFTVLVGGLVGCFSGFGLLYWIAVIAYPHNVGGRPLDSWPSFIPITFECTILLSAFAAVLGMLAMNGLPKLHHPVFNVAEFQRASVDKFFLCLESADPLFQVDRAGDALEAWGGKEVTVVPL